MLKEEGARMVCKTCQVEIHCKRMHDDRLSWRNADGSSHWIKNEETGQFEHCPTKMTPMEVWQSEIEERLARIERQMGIMWGE